MRETRCSHRMRSPHGLYSLLLLSAGFLVGTFVSAAWSQGQQQTQPAAQEYVQINFMKVPPGGAETYARWERDTIRPIMQQRVRQGAMKRWAVYQVVWPRGTEREYDFITLDVYSQYAQTSRNFGGLHMTKLAMRSGGRASPARARGVQGSPSPRWRSGHDGE